MTASNSGDAEFLSIGHAGLRAIVTPYGARLVQCLFNDEPMCLGFETLAGYHADTMSLGAVCGRYGNRIENAQLTRNGQVWQLDKNDGEQCIHGGSHGFGERDWQVVAHSSESITFSLTSEDGDQGWPGQCQAFCQYQIQDALLIWTAWAEVSQACPLNLIQHAYWNLGGGRATDHQLRIPADSFWLTDDRNLPIESVPLTGDLDFRELRPIPHARYDGAFMVPGQGLREVAELIGPQARARFFSDQPSIQLYTAGSLSPTAAHWGQPHDSGSAVCLETQQMPNGPALGSPVWIEPGQTYRHHLRILFQSTESQL